MNWRIILLVFVAQFALGNEDDPSEKRVVLVVVNGKSIDRAGVDLAANIQFKMWSFRTKNEPSISEAERERMLAGFKEKAVEDLINKRLILEQFRLAGGTINRKYIDSAIDQFIEMRFNGNRDSFLQELEKSKISFEEFRKSQEEAIILQAMSNQKAIGETEAERKRNLENWLGGLRKKASIRYHVDSPLASEGKAEPKPGKKVRSQ
ncbi:MAG: SurA N-terminal domain-containing protein [Verrucomicrobiae bacterium]|nr:SurA N-terminal domain-containing protein [Verrucomicrobiae bacterium]MCP5550006.1 SurA N-terminal domain-containing protein [Akkermansiaceae bacterium]